jgi:hypothetical protein
VLPRRLGVRFALEALFLVALAVAAGLAHLRPLYILIAMAVAWLLVAAAELTAERIDRSSVSYLLPEPAREDEEEAADRIYRPRPEERTVVAPPAAHQPVEESEPAEEPEVEAAAVEVEPAPQEIEADEPEEAAAEATGDELPPEPAQPGRRRFLFRRRSQELEPDSPAPPRHVKLLPRRSTPEPSRASKEVAELFGSGGDEGEERVKPEETGT